MNPAPVLTAAVLALSFASVGAHAATDFIVNGSFEASGPDLTPGGGSYCYRNYAPLECGSLPGWNNSGLPVMSTNSGPWGNPSGMAGWTAANGALQVGLQGASYLEQMVSLPGAGSYTLTWQDAGRSGYANQNYTVSYAGNTLAPNFSTTAGQGWATHSITFAAAGSGMLMFKGLPVAVGADGTSFIDTVSLTAAVPEPGSYALLLAGLAVVGGAARRRSHGA